MLYGEKEEEKEEVKVTEAGKGGRGRRRVLSFFLITLLLSFCAEEEEAHLATRVNKSGED